MTLETTLYKAGIDIAGVIAQLGQVQASEDREGGKFFEFRDHLRGLILSLLSNQRPWEPIARNRDQIDAIFFNYDPDRVQATDPLQFVWSLRDIRCGNRAMVKQMDCLSVNIATMKRIVSERGSLDEFVESADPDSIAKALSDPGPYKLKQVGFALALEYLRNVGIRAAKPDSHILRVLSGQCLGYLSDRPKPIEASVLVAKLAKLSGSNPTYLDNLLWMLCAKNYGDICGEKPRCHDCGFERTCNFPHSRPVIG
ncbi:MAG: hypothetical protein A3H93_19980 [Rhodocyclales bacterium RIFCSPLOWO2_02_FULL_63_24]|nr:MAG: hypothetical protein A3H93_19980 [Rhodocyclales bacterium RIFCSPLOWO2_02_FULL_63_24]